LEDPKNFALQGDPSAEGSTIEGQPYGRDETDYISNRLRELREELIRILIYFIFIYLLSNETNSEPICGFGIQKKR